MNALKLVAEAGVRMPSQRSTQVGPKGCWFFPFWEVFQFNSEGIFIHHSPPSESRSFFSDLPFLMFFLCRYFPEFKTIYRWFLDPPRWPNWWPWQVVMMWRLELVVVIAGCEIWYQGIFAQRKNLSTG